jgi:hypothetical protein
VGVASAGAGLGYIGGGGRASAAGLVIACVSITGWLGCIWWAGAASALGVVDVARFEITSGVGGEDNIVDADGAAWALGAAASMVMPVLVDLAVVATTILVPTLNDALRYAGMVGHKLVGLVSGVGAGAGAGLHKLVGGLGVGLGLGAGAGTGAGAGATSNGDSRVSSVPTSAAMPIIWIGLG